MIRTEKAALCFLHVIKGIGSKSLWKIKDSFGSFENCLKSDSSALYAALKPEIAQAIISRRQQSSIFFYLEQLEDKGINLVSFEEPDYPPMLRNIYSPPFMLYFRGYMESLEELCLAVVGSRAASDYGRTTARKLGNNLASRGISVVSGMARGIDAEAHRGALDAGGRTVAVLGSGLNVIYPRSNTRLYHEIIEHGVVISEFPLDTNPDARNFPMRNRIISGISRGVVVVEARARSGALITADFALEQGRDVFAVPGPINRESSLGANNLIKQGAKLITGVEDIIEEYYDITIPESECPVQEQLLFLDEQERVLINCLAENSLLFDDIIASTGFTIGQLSSLLLKLELAGIVKSLPGNYYGKV
ncbi:MAG: DNA-processing protein DprA [Syntrophomonas sp.]|uniref:DNA-processing protein DprA n=1 Tax=Syntrophomonas sp. TaxID=2053627 RepID=UPI002638FAB1|nr:DNA-processing protein DprA [Syntrophomonas sp.]MDD2509664.1 DNA-processing protein DprA [Syntrophomonas sp.]MDD3878499.1 DNA-processing protein DprA [Syntrophomonas sp.]MDD4625674.1 DNA-processing protein DprA [Syntrophomonas sp.]